MGLLGQGFIYIITWNMNGKASEKVTYKYKEGWSLINLTFLIRDSTVPVL